MRRLGRVARLGRTSPRAGLPLDGSAAAGRVRLGAWGWDAPSAAAAAAYERAWSKASGELAGSRGFAAEAAGPAPDRERDGGPEEGPRDAGGGGGLAEQRRRPAGTVGGLDARLVPLAFGQVLMASSVGVVLPILPLLARELDIGTAALGSIISSLGFARLLLNGPMGGLADAYGRKPLLVAGSVLTSAGMLGTGVCSGFYSLLAWRLATGAGGSMHAAGALLSAADVSTRDTRARTMGTLQTATSIGLSLGPAVGGLLTDAMGVRAPFFAVGGVSAFTAVFMRYGYQETIRRPPTGQLRLSGAAQGLRQWGSLLSKRNLQLGYAVHTMLWLTGSGAQYTLLPLLATDRFGMTPTALGTTFAAMAGASVLLTPVASWVADKHGRKAVIVPGAAALASALALVPYASSLESFTALTMLWATGNTLMSAGPAAYVTDNVPFDRRVQALSLYRSSGDVGLLLGPGIMGAVADYMSLDAALGVNAALVAGVGLAFGALAGPAPRVHVPATAATVAAATKH